MDENNRRSNIQQAPHHGENKSPKSKYNEEYAAEFTADKSHVNSSGDVVSTYGWIGIVLSVLSFLVWPLLFGVAGIILGFVSRSKGADALGNIAIGIGVLSIILEFII